LDNVSLGMFAPTLGDMNHDGVVNGLDVDPFVDVLLNGSFDPSADMNRDAQVNGLDVDPFVDAVIGGTTQPVPEPSTLLLAVVALGAAVHGLGRRGTAIWRVSPPSTPPHNVADLSRCVKAGSFAATLRSREARTDP
jgi:hypothetical protein